MGLERAAVRVVADDAEDRLSLGAVLLQVVPLLRELLLQRHPAFVALLAVRTPAGVRRRVAVRRNAPLLHERVVRPRMALAAARGRRLVRQHRAERRRLHRGVVHVLPARPVARLALHVQIPFVPGSHPASVPFSRVPVLRHGVARLTIRGRMVARLQARPRIRVAMASPLPQEGRVAVPAARQLVRRVPDVAQEAVDLVRRLIEGRPLHEHLVVGTRAQGEAEHRDQRHNQPSAHGNCLSHRRLQRRGLNVTVLLNRAKDLVIHRHLPGRGRAYPVIAIRAYTYGSRPAPPRGMDGHKWGLIGRLSINNDTELRYDTPLSRMRKVLLSVSYDPVG